MRKSNLFFVAAAALLGAAAVPAAAEEASVVVSIADLDLTTAKGTEALDARVDNAAGKVCDKPSTIRDLKSMQAWESCKVEAHAKAMDQLSLANPFEGMALASLF